MAEQDRVETVSGSDGQQNHVLLQMSFVLGSGLLLIWGHRLLPLQDYPDWLIQGKLFSNWLRGTLDGVYAFKGVLVPNAIATVCIGLLSLISDLEVAGKLTVSAYVAGYVGAVAHLCGLLGRSASPTLLAVSLTFVFNYTFWHGELNYGLGLAALFGAQSMVLRSCAAPNGRLILGVTLASLVIYACHGAAYAAWLMFLAAYAWESRRLYTRIWFALAVSPSLVFVVIYTLSMAAATRPVLLGWSLPDKLWLIVKSLCPFQAFYPYFDPPAASVLLAGNAIVIAYAGWALARGLMFKRESLGLNERAIRATLILYLIAFIAAPNNLAGLLQPAERLILPALQLLLVWRVWSWRTAPSRHATLKSSWIILVTQMIYMQLYGGYVSGQLASVHRQLRGFVQKSAVSVLHESHFHFEGRAHPTRPLAWRLLPTHYPVIRVTHYANLEFGRPMPIFETGLFYNRSTYLQNSTDSVAHAPKDAPIVIIGWPPGNRAVRALLPGETAELATDNRSFSVIGSAGER